MKFYFYFFIIIYFFCFSSCGEQPPFSGKIKITPDSDYASTIYLIQPRNFDEIASSYEGVVLDSAKIDKAGNFSFNKMPEGKEPILLQVAVQKKGEKFLNQLENDSFEAANYFPMIWENGSTISITADVEHFQKSFSIENPSPQNEELIQLRDVRYDSFQKHFSKKDMDAHDENKIIERADALLNFQKPLISFANQTVGLLPAIVAIRWVSVEGDYERVPEFLFNQCEKWKKLNPDHPFVIQLCEKSSRDILPVMKGDIIPDFPLPMLSGDTIQLNKILGKKLTIIDLWASWCAPCRKENRNYLVPLWDKYHEEGFQIIGYAIDAGERAWRSAIKKDGADRWLHASHLQGDESPFFSKLNIKTIPANFLIDEEGKVIAKNLHGEELMTFVNDHMKN